MNKYVFLTPGPTPVPKEVLDVSALPIIHHRTDEFGAIFASVLGGMKYVFRTKNDVLLLTASGTGAMEATVANLLSLGDEVLVASCGAFGERWVKICEIFGTKVHAVRAEWGRPVEPELVERELKTHGNIKAIFCTHTETSTGTVCDVKSYAEIVSKTEAVLAVDAISGLAGQELRTDEWNLDCVVAASQKGLMNAPGLALVALNEKTWRLVEKSTSPRFYWDFRKMKKSIGDRETPFTPAINLIRAQEEALKRILQEGIEKVWHRTKQLALWTREQMNTLELPLFSTTPCDVLTAGTLPEGVNGSELLKRLRKNHGVWLADGQEKLKGKIVRIAHMGAITQEDLQTGLTALQQELSYLRAGSPI